MKANNSLTIAHVISIQKEGIIVEYAGGKPGIVPREEMQRAEMKTTHANIGDLLEVYPSKARYKGKIVFKLVRTYSDTQATHQRTSSFQLSIPENFYTPLIVMRKKPPHLYRLEMNCAKLR